MKKHKINSVDALEDIWASKPPPEEDPIEQCAKAFFYMAKKNNISVQKQWELFEAGEKKD